MFDIGDLVKKAGILTAYWGVEKLPDIIRDNYADDFKDPELRRVAADLSKAILELGKNATVMQFLDNYRMDFIIHRKIVDELDNLKADELKAAAMHSLNFVTNIILKWQDEGVFEK